jgi:hypothetical protein
MFSTTSLLVSIGTITSSPMALAFAPSLLSTTNRVNRGLHFYLPDDGGYGGGYPGGYDMMESQYGPPPEPGFEMMYDHAFACANNPGMCNIDELMGLAQGKLIFSVQ